ncbi:hypothetical protein CEE45_08700 [Candidatus Heimdallarchaeota archaeon B3_Heim]|nr:MAG: hypothetical protein CEE45_08700 [Candidatus Heimdallarchaeota archaeon B3_Heim]
MKQNKVLLAILFFGIAFSFISINPSLANTTEVPNGYFDLYLYQDHYLAIGETGLMGFDIYSNFDVSLDVNISLILFTPSGEVTLYSIQNNFSAGGYLYDEVYYTFSEQGYYDVLLYVIDGYGRDWKADCWWEVSEPWMDLWIGQDNYASMGDTGYMALDIVSHFSRNMTVSAKVVIITPSGTEDLIYENNSVSIAASGYWYADVLYFFPEVGHYKVIFSVSDGFGYWETQCWWEVYDEQEYLALWIYQDHHRMVNEDGWMDFVVENRFSINKTLTVRILLIGPNEEIILYNETVEVTPRDSWSFYTEYYFTEPGYYEVALLVTDHATDRVWDFWCWWEINGYDLFIDQEYTAKVGETKWMHFKAQSNFAHDMPSVIINIRMEDPTGYTELLLEVDVPINAHGIWEIDLNYTFTQTGDYFVHFELYDDIGYGWFAKCDWTISESGPEIYVNGPASVDINETFEIEGKVYSGFTDELHVKTITLAWENGTEIETVNVSKTIPPDSYTYAYFNVTIPVSGEFVFRITADTSKGMLETKYFVEVGIIDNTTNQETDTTPTLTPGFESVFGLLALVLAIPIIRKHRQ